MLDNVNAIIKARFDQVWAQIKAAGFSSDVHPEESKIRLELPILAGKGQYIFDLKTTDVDNVVTHSLNRNDVFVPNRLGVFVALKDANGVETLFPYIPVNDGTNPSMHAFGFQNANMNNLYAGYLDWRVDSTVALSAYPMEKFHKVPRFQGSALLKSDDSIQLVGAQSEWSVDEAMELLIPKYTVAGTHDHKIEINFPASTLTFPVTSGYTAHLVLMMDGFLVKGGCQYKGGTGRNPFDEAVGQW